MLAQQEDFEVWEENVPALEVFVRLATQWKIGAMGGFLGLDYSAVEATLRMLRIENTAEVFDSIQAMELAALPVLNDKKA